MICFVLAFIQLVWFLNVHSKEAKDILKFGSVFLLLTGLLIELIEIKQLLSAG